MIRKFKSMQLMQTEINKLNRYLIDLVKSNWRVIILLFTLVVLLQFFILPYLENKLDNYALKVEAEPFSEQVVIDENDFRNNRFEVLLDVRSRDEYEKGHVQGAINIDHREILNDPGILQENNIGLHDVVLVYCRTGRRAQKVIDHLRDSGYDMDNIYMTPLAHQDISQLIH